jgi:Kelch motif
MQRVYLRRRIVAGVLVLGIPLLIVLILLRSGGNGGGGGTNVASHTTTTAPSRATTTTAPPQLVVAAATWQLPEPLSRSVVLPVNADVGVFGGLTTGATSGHVYQIDPTSGTATLMGTMPSPVHDSAGAVIAGGWFVFGGGAATETAAVQHFTTSTPSHVTGSVVGNLPAKRADLVTVTANGHIYLLGGFDGTKWLPQVLDTTDGNAFNTVAELAPPVRYPAAAVLNGKLYVIGGELSPNQADATAVQAIDLQTNAVTQLGPLPTALSHAAAATLNGTIYVFGGRTGGHSIDTVSVLNTTTGQLQPVAHLPAARSDMGVGVVGQTVYLVGGEGDNGKPVTTVFTAKLG